MERTLSLDCQNQVGETVQVMGWIDALRTHGQVTFIDLRDRSGKIQIVGGKDLKILSLESPLSVVGKVINREDSAVNPNLETGTIEIQVESYEVLAKAAELPFDIHKENLNLELPTLLDYRSLSLRHPQIQAIFRVQAVVIDAFRRALQAKDFFEFQAPSIISSAPEGGADIFEVKYFNNKAYLAQSPQLYKSLLVSAFERVFSVNKVWRAEPSVTARHLTEVVSLDAEMGFIQSWLEVKDMAEYVVKFILNEVSAHCAAELALFQAKIPQVPTQIPFLKLREAQEIIFTRTGRDCRQEKDLAPEDEREICKWALEEKQSDLVFISHYPTKNRPFYTYPDPEDPNFNQGFDLLGRGIEWLTGGRRIHDYQTLLQHVEKWGITPENISLYLQAYKYGMPPLGGFAFGAERITMQILSLKNIREATLFPRDMERIDVRFSSSQKPQTASTLKPYEALLQKLKQAHIDYKHYEHEPVHTSAEAMSVRGDVSLHQGAKALVLQADKNFILLVLPGDCRADLDALKQYLGVKRLAMASKESVEEKTGIAVGAVPPFGSLINLKTYVDKRLGENQEIVFNAARHDRSIKMPYSDFIKLENPILLP